MENTQHSTLTISFMLFLALSLVMAPVAFALTITDGMSASNVLGQPDFTTKTGGIRNTTSLQAPKSVIVDEINNRTYVADSTNYRVLVYDTTTITDGMAAWRVLGTDGFSGSWSLSVTQSSLDQPTGLALDIEGNRLFVSQKGSSRISVFDVTTIDNGENAINVLGQDDFISPSANKNAGTPIASGLSSPEDVEYDSVHDLLYVADEMNHRVLVFDVASITDGEDAINVLGKPSLTATESLGATAGNLNQPSGLALDADNNRLFVSSFSHNRVLVFDAASITDGENAINVLGQPDFTSSSELSVSASTLRTPAELDYDEESGYLFVYTGGSRALIFDASVITNNESAIYVLGQPDMTSNGANYGGALVSDGRGGFTTLPSQTGLSTGGTGGLYFDNTNSLLYVADGDNNRVLVFDISTSVEEPTSRGYTPPPTCTATITPNTITKGDSATLSWDIEWLTDKRSTFYMKVPKEGLYSSKVQSISISPEYTTTYRLATFNLFGANFCDTTVTVQDEQGIELTKQDSLLSASASSNPFMRAILSFFSSLFGR